MRVGDAQRGVVQACLFVVLVTGAVTRLGAAPGAQQTRHPRLGR